MEHVRMYFAGTASEVFVFLVIVIVFLYEVWQDTGK